MIGIAIEAIYFLIAEGFEFIFFSTVFTILPGIIMLVIVNKYKNKTRLRSFAVVVMILVISLPVILPTLAGQPITQGQGNGNPIKSCQELQNISQDPSADYYLSNDIDCSDTKNWNDGKGFKPINGFSGSFDGKGNLISDLYINRPNVGNVGLFGVVEIKSEVEDVGLEDVNITGDGSVGGLVGHVDGGNVSSSYVTGSVKGNKIVGGLIGDNYYGSISNSYATVSVTGKNQVGGLIGGNDGKVSDSYSTGNILHTGESEYVNYNVGGLIGEDNSGREISDCFWDTETTGQDKGIGDGSGDVQGKTTNEMQTKSTFTDAGWDFEETWYMKNYPDLQWNK